MLVLLDAQCSKTRIAILSGKYVTCSTISSMQADQSASSSALTSMPNASNLELVLGTRGCSVVPLSELQKHGYKGDGGCLLAFRLFTLFDWMVHAVFRHEAQVVKLNLIKCIS